ncbi:hypothetical protein [Streptomyces rubiginosohelvolus]|uniref:hypothetical protein n=1 Tax=Streptomyces rubiginosohelvolus TaxID=67362 RepID=UPI0036B49A79
MPGPRRKRPAPPVRALDPVLAARLGALLAEVPATGEHRTETGETYAALTTGLVVEVLPGRAVTAR